MESKTSEPTTGEIVRMLRDEAQFELGGKRSTILLTTIQSVIDRLESQERKLSGITGELERMTARAEQAEAREKAAVKDLEELLAQEDFIGVCWACGKKDECNKDVYRIEGCKPKWRGLPQDGEGE